MAETKVLHTRISVHKRASPRSSATRSAAYRSCSKIEDMNTGEIHDFTKKKHLVEKGIQTPKNAPAWTKDRATLWGKSDQAETRKDAQLAREVVFSLPRGMSKHNQIMLVMMVCDELFASRGMVADWAIHAQGDGDKRNRHVHILLSTRDLTEEGFGKKNREWNDPRYAIHWRRTIAELTNVHTQGELSKDSVFMSHKGFSDLGIERIPKKRISRELYYLRKSNTIEVETSTKEVQNERPAPQKITQEDSKPGIERGEKDSSPRPQKTREPDFGY